MFCDYTEVMAQDDKSRLNKTTPHLQLLPMSKTPIPLDGDSATIQILVKMTIIAAETARAYM